MVVPVGPSREPGDGERGPRSLVERLRDAVDSLHDVEARRGLAWPIYAARVAVQVVKQWVRDRCPQQAASLAFSTALSIVPLVAVALALLRATGEFEAQSTLVTFLAREVLPSMARDEIARHLLSFAGNMSFEAAGLAGTITTIVLSFIMYLAVERIFNDIWRVERRRPLGHQFLLFYAAITFTPALLAYSLVHAARSGLTEGPLGSLAALAATFTALFLANKLLPATRVRWKAAAAGALVSALLFEGAKYLFQLYVAKVAFQSYAGVYGALALVPILLVWIYYSWLVVLLGCEVAHSVQNLHDLEGAERRASDRDTLAQVNGVVAARFMCAIAERWRAGGRATPRSELTVRFAVDEDAAERVLRRLREGGLVLEVEGADATGYLPARPTVDITLADVLDLFRGSDVGARSPGRPASRLDALLADLDEAQKSRARAVTVDELASA